MNIFQILRNPFVKIIGAGIIIYFALFHDKSNPDALGNRLDPQRVKSELNEAREKGNFIISNVTLAKQLAEENAKKRAIETANNSEVSVYDVDAGMDGDKSACGDIVEINYGIFDVDNKQLEFKEKQKFILGNHENDVIEKNIIGMGQAGVRDIRIPINFKTSDKELLKLMQFNRGELRYQITMLSFLHNPDSKLSCK